MLAAHRPAMDNYQSPDGALPYTLRPVDTDENIAYSLPLQSPSHSQSQHPDLSNLDNLVGSAAVLDNWLDNLSNQPDYHGEGLNFDPGWGAALAPSLMGHTSSYGQYGQQPPLPPAWSPGAAALFPPAHQDHFGFDPLASAVQPLPQYQQPNLPAPTADAGSPIDAATVLANLGNGHLVSQQRALPASQPRNSHGRDLSTQRNMLRTTMHGGLHPQAYNPSAAAQRSPTAPVVETESFTQYRQAPRQGRQYYPPHLSSSPISPQTPSHADRTPNDGTGLFVDMFFGSKAEPSGAPRSAETPDVMRWGSDTNFGSDSRFAPPAPESHEPRADGRPNLLHCLQLNQSAANSRPTTPPENIRRDSQHAEQSLDKPPSLPADEKAQTTPTSPVRKQKTKSRGKQPRTETDRDETAVAAAPDKTPAKKRKSKTEPKGPAEAPVAADAQKKRRKSAPKPNLTDAQKRTNHIKSEQRRRGAIKEGFADLTELVPDLQTSGLSKSNVLNVAGDWLEALLKGNAELA